MTYYTDNELAKTAKMLSSVSHEQLETILAKMSDHSRCILAHAVKKVQTELGPISGSWANPNGIICEGCGFDDCEIRNCEDDDRKFISCGYCDCITYLD